MPFEEIVIKTLQDFEFDEAVIQRAKFLLEKTERDFFVSDTDKQEYRSRIRANKESDMEAVLYLLCANEVLFERAMPHIKHNGVMFEQNLHDISVEAYTLLKAAKGIYFDENEIMQEELADKEIVSDENLLLIVTAYVILAYGQKTIWR